MQVEFQRAFTDAREFNVSNNVRRPGIFSANPLERNASEAKARDKMSAHCFLLVEAVGTFSQSEFRSTVGTSLFVGDTPAASITR